MNLSSIFEKAAHVAAVVMGSYLGAGVELGCDIVFGTTDIAFKTYPLLSQIYGASALLGMPALGTMILNRRQQADNPYMNSGCIGATAGFIAGGVTIGSFTPLVRLIY